MGEVYFSNSPHVKGGNSTRKIMIEVLIALFPACLAGCLFFGIWAFITLAVGTVFAVLSEFVYYLIAGKKFKTILREFDFSSAVTGVLTGMLLPPKIPVYVPMLSAIFAVVVVKLLFGGTGKNIVNPAITGRIFAFLSFAALFSAGYYVPTLFGTVNPVGNELVSGATNLEPLLSSGVSPISNIDLFLGTGVAGSVGETCKLALILGGIFLIIVKVIDFRWPLVYILVTGLFSVCLEGFDFSLFLPSILSGGLILGAIFMATDYTTSPNTKTGCYIYYIAMGLLTAGLRKATGMEVVSFAIILMNLFVPLIDKYFVNKPFGHVKPIKNKGDNK